MSGVPVLKSSCSTLVRSLLERNHKEHHIFFSNKLHNHFPHALLSLYYLGADEERLKREWKLESYLSPIPKKKNTEITDDNWKQFIGDDSYYPNYLEFFDRQIEKNGKMDTILKYAFDPQLIPSLVAGAVHPLIHLGFGVEFDESMVVAEGLSEACVHLPRPASLLDFHDIRKGEGKSALEILKDVRNDKSLDGLIDFKDENKTNTTIDKASEIIKKHSAEWVVEDNPDSIASALRDLFQLAVHVYATTSFHPHNPMSKDVKLDFFLMHVLTSTLSVRQIIPHLSPSAARTLLKSHFPIALLYYIARGRPECNTEALRAYKVEGLTTWDDVVALAVKSEDIHVPKVVRTLKIADGMYNKDKEDDLWFKAAALTVDRHVNKGEDWDFSAIGFPQAWSVQSK